MNAIDLYDYDGSLGPEKDTETESTDNKNEAQPTLNEEVNQVIGQIGRFWGGFRKQVSTTWDI
jgi:hypothetical protein